MVRPLLILLTGLAVVLTTSLLATSASTVKTLSLPVPSQLPCFVVSVGTGDKGETVTVCPPFLQ